MFTKFIYLYTCIWTISTSWLLNVIRLHYNVMGALLNLINVDGDAKLLLQGTTG